MSVTLKRIILIFCLAFSCVLASDLNEGMFFVTSCVGDHSISPADNVTEGSHCDYTCSVPDLKENENFVIYKYHQYCTLSSTCRISEESYDIFNSDTGFTKPVDDTHRYHVAQQTRTMVEIAFSEVVPGDSGWYQCRTEYDMVTVGTSPRILIQVKGDRINPHFAMKKSKEDHELEKVYLNNTSVNLTKEEYNHLAFVVDIAGLLTNQPRSQILVQKGTETKDLTRPWVVPDLANYTPDEVIPTDSHHVEMYNNFEMELDTGDELIMEGRLTYYDKTYSALLNVYIVESENDAHVTRPSFLMTLLSIFIVAFKCH